MHSATIYCNLLQLLLQPLSSTVATMTTTATVPLATVYQLSTVALCILQPTATAVTTTSSTVATLTTTATMQRATALCTGVLCTVKQLCMMQYYITIHTYTCHTLMPPTPVLPIVRLTCSSQFLHVLQQLLSYMYTSEPQYGCIYSTESASQVICRLLAPCKKLGN